MPITVYIYNGKKDMLLPGYGKWIKIKPGQEIVVASHTKCKTCDRCPGKMKVIDPPGINSDWDGICFLQTSYRRDENGHEISESIFPLTVGMELKFEKNEKEKNPHRLLRPLEHK